MRCLCLAMVLAIGAGSASARRLPIQVFASAQGLPRNSAECLASGATGVLWICTSEGLVRFDGQHFRVFGPDDGLPSRNILNFQPSRKGGYWLLTNQGACRLAADSKVGQPCRPLVTSHPETNLSDYTILESNAGDTWIANGTSLFHVSSDERRLEPTTFREPRHEMILMLADGLAGAILVGTETQLLEWRPGGDTRILSGAVGDIGPQQALRLASGDLLLAATNGLFRLSQQHDRCSIERQQLPGMARVNAILRRRDGSIWIAGTGGLMRLEIGRRGEIRLAEHYTAGDGLPGAQITALIEDAQGNLWGATEASGIFCLAVSGFISYSEKDGLGDPRIAAIFEDRTGRLMVHASWVHGPVLRAKDGNRFQEIRIGHPASIALGWGWNQYVLAAHDGEWWLPTGRGLFRFPAPVRTEDLAGAKASAVYDARSALGCDAVFRTFEDSAGNIWVGCLGPTRQLTRWERNTGTFRHWTSADGWPDGSVETVIREGPQGVLWIGTGSAAVRFRNGRFDVFTLAAGRAPNVRDLLIDRSGRIWVATLLGGLFRCDNPGDARPVFRSYTVREGLSTDSVRSLAEDRAGLIYAGTARGVDRIDPAAAIGERRIRHFTVADGLPDSEQNTAFRDHQGHLWFGTLDGLSEFDPAKAVRPQPPEVYLMRLRVHGEDVPLPWDGSRASSLELAADRNQVEIEYAGVNVTSGGSLHYQYRLRGADNTWSELVDRQSVNYASLPAGPLRFEVRAVDADGQWSPRIASLDVLVRAPVWRQWWFLALLSGACIASAISFERYRAARMRQVATALADSQRLTGELEDERLALQQANSALRRSREERLAELERVRRRIATDLHDDIGSSLTQISVLSEVVSRMAGKQQSGILHYLGLIGSSSRELIDSMSDIVWAINPQRDHLSDLSHRMRRFASDTLGARAIAFEMRLPADSADARLEGNLRREVFLIFKEAVNNIVRHSGCARVEIDLRLHQGLLGLELRDDGSGFEPGGDDDGHGLKSMRSRAQELGGTFELMSAPGSGTRIRMEAPVAQTSPESSTNSGAK